MGNRKILLILFLTVLILVPFLSFAQPSPPPSKTGLVQCGTELNPAPCTTCDFIVLANKIITFLMQNIILPLAALGILAAAIMILTAGGSEGRIKTGKTMLFNILIGFFIAISAWAILNTVLGKIIEPEYNFLTETFPGCK